MSPQNFYRSVSQEELLDSYYMQGSVLSVGKVESHKQKSNTSCHMEQCFYKGAYPKQQKKGRALEKCKKKK